jgi:hypothetical protein
MSGKVTKNDFFKSLERLEALAGSGGEMRKSQIVQGGNSEVSSWPGGEKEEIGDNWDDSIGEDGTDYKAKGVRKSIAEKVMKGIPLSPEEVTILKGDMEKAEPFGGKETPEEEEDEEKAKGKRRPPPKKEEEEEEEEEGIKGKLFGKSFTDVLSENETVQKGVEVSDFLAEFAKSFGHGLAHLEARVTERVIGNVMSGLQQFASEQGEFNKSLAEAVVNIGHGLAGYIQQDAARSEEPAGPPKSQLRTMPGKVQVLEKSQTGSAFEGMNKAQLLDRMTDMVEKGGLNPLEVVKYESTGEMSPGVEQKLRKSMGQ